MSETLKPCPFCGNPPLVWNDDGGSPEGYATISCESGCGNTSMSRKLRSGFVVNPEPAEETWRIVRERWNTRADDNRWRSVAEQAEKLLKRARNLTGYSENLRDEIDANLAAFDSLRKEGQDG